MFDVLEEQISIDLMEEGKWENFKYPKGDFIGEQMFADPGDPTADPPIEPALPCRFKVRSWRSKFFMEEERKFARLQQAKTKRMSADMRRINDEEIEKTTRARRFSLVLIALENCDRTKPGVQSPTQQQAFEMGMKANLAWMVEQVMAVAFDDSAFGEPPKGKDAPADKKPKT